MKIIDAIWEIRNLGKKTIEIILENDEMKKSSAYICQMLEDVEKEYLPQYMVVKLPTGNPWCGNLLRLRDYNFIEMQIALQANKAEARYCIEKYGRMFKTAKWNEAMAPEDVEYVKSEIRKGIFFTDRISLDKKFGVEKANERYANYIGDAIEHGAELFYMVLGEEKLGFFLDRYNDEYCNGLLAGLFLSAQNRNLGGIQYYLEFDRAINFMNCSKFLASVSSNNLVSVRLLELFGGRINSMHEVYIKHND